LAAVATNENVREAMKKIGALTTSPGGVEMRLFSTIEEAEDWLNQPLTYTV